MDKKCENELFCRRNAVGGQAVIEGVMMKHKERVSLAVRKADGSVVIKNQQKPSFKSKHAWAKLPFIRGIVGFIESLVLSFGTLNDATELLDLDGLDGKEKTEKEKKKSAFTTSVVMIFSLLLGLGLALLLFNLAPTYATRGVNYLLTDVFHRSAMGQVGIGLVEGLIKILIFIGYIASVSLMKDIRRTFEYHGAEHKSIACYESGLPLTPENAKKCTRFHPRCGTSFMFVMVLLGVIVGMFVPDFENVLFRSLTKLALFPVIVGIGYEFIMYAGKHDNLFTKICSAPGLWMQRLTTKEPDENELAIAICAIKSALPDEFPDFTPDEYFISEEQNRGHIAFEEKKDEK